MGDGKRFPAVVRYSAFAQMRNGKPTSMWERMYAEQLEECAEAKALRRAFPHDLGVIYLEDEMPAEPAAPRRVRAVVEAPARRRVLGPPEADETPLGGSTTGLGRAEG